jgi:hypothetical protein
MCRKGQSTAAIGKKKRTWLRRPKHSLFTPFLLSDLFLESSMGLLTDWFVALEPVVRAARRGMWQNGTDIELPADYKKRHRVVEVEAKVEDGVVEEPEDVEPEKQVGFLRRIFGQRKRTGDK